MQALHVTPADRTCQLSLDLDQLPRAVHHRAEPELGQKHPPGTSVIGVGINAHHALLDHVSHQLLNCLLGDPDSPRELGDSNAAQRLQVGDQPGMGLAQHRLTGSGVDPRDTALIEQLTAPNQHVPQAAGLLPGELLGIRQRHVVNPT